VIDLPDVNVWVALTAKGHIHHDRAHEYWQQQAHERIAFCPATAMGMLRTLTNRHSLEGEPLTVKEAWDVYREWRRNPIVGYKREPKTCNVQIDRLVTAGQIRPRTWSDAYLAAFAQSAGMRLITFDSDFKRFEGLNVLYLTN
jgi:toxin-antitoxin system PIN domain toxin